MNCPCGSGKSFEACCGPYLSGAAKPPTAEALMRARYTAHVRGDIEFIAATFAPKSGAAAHGEATRRWLEKAKFTKLQVAGTQRGGVRDRAGMVEFLATYEEGGQAWDHHEVSEFARDPDGNWVFVRGDGHRHRAGEGHHHGHHHHHHGHGHHGHDHQGQGAGQTLRREGPKVGRNDPCPCGSGKKYKKCHGADA